VKIRNGLFFALVGLAAILLVGPLIIPIPALADTLPSEDLADADSRFIEVNGLKVHYKMAGQGEPLILLLHGFGASVFSWREVMTPLAQFGTVVAYDRPAFGLTERPLPGSWSGDSPYGLAANADLLADLISELGFQKAILIGNSAGGTLATYFALQHPEKVMALVEVDAAIYESGGPGWLRAISSLPQVNRLGPLLVRSIQNRGMDLIYQAWHDPGKITPEIIAGYRKPLQAVHWDVGLWELTRANVPNNLPVQLGQIKPPVLVVTGDDDRIVPTANSLRLATEIPGAKLAIIPNCGHVPQEECPQQFLKAVTDFIQPQVN
jgi:pimeloyl-ACP methyl ester carboxylesterase